MPGMSQVAMKMHNSVFLPAVTSAATAVESLISDADSASNQMAGDSASNQMAEDSASNKMAGNAASNQLVVIELHEPYIISSDSDSDGSGSSQLFLVRLSDSSSIKDVGKNPN